MSIATELTNYSTYLTNAYNKASAKNATIPASKNLQNLTNCIGSLPTKSVESKDVDFIDYDGTILYSYTASEFANLTALPTNPTHDGLTSTGWNWTLANAKTYVATNGFLDIGATYTTTDKKTHVYVDLPEDLKSMSLGLRIKANSKVVIDWGDNSATTTLEIASYNDYSTPHTYTNKGMYCIKINVVTGNASIYSFNSSHCPLIQYSNNTINERSASTIKKVEMGRNMGIGFYSFAYCSGLEEIVLSSDTQDTDFVDIPQNAFYYNANLKAVVVPTSYSGVKSNAFYYTQAKRISLPFDISLASSTNYVFSYNFALERMALPTTASWGGSYEFRQCRGLKRIAFQKENTNPSSYNFHTCTSLYELKIPQGVTQVVANSFNSCTSLLRLDFSSATTVPSLSNVNAFTGTPSNLKIIVPDSLYDTWKTTGNWSNSAVVNKITKASQA